MPKSKKSQLAARAESSTSPLSATFLNDLSVDFMMLIASFLNWRSLIEFSTTNPYHRTVLSDSGRSHYLWKFLSEARWPAFTPMTPLTNARSSSLQDAFIAKHEIYKYAISSAY